jgi:hypothetical protein
VTQDLQPSADDRYRAGRREGLALSALAMALVAFINVLSLEKALLAAGLALLALRASPIAPPGRKAQGVLGIVLDHKAQWALGIALVYVVSWVALIVIFHEKFARLFQLLQQLG